MKLKLGVLLFCSAAFHPAQAAKLVAEFHGVVGEGYASPIGERVDLKGRPITLTLDVAEGCGSFSMLGFYSEIMTSECSPFFSNGSLDYQISSTNGLASGSIIVQGQRGGRNDSGGYSLVFSDARGSLAALTGQGSGGAYVQFSEWGYATYVVYSFTLTSGFVGLTDIPEPATWAMMIMGFGMLGAAARRRPRPSMTTGASRGWL